MRSTKNRFVVLATLLFLGIETNAQITVKIDSLIYSRKISNPYFADNEGPGIRAFFTLENHSGKDILVFTLEGDPRDFWERKPFVSQDLELLFEYDGLKYKSSPMDLVVESRTVTYSDDEYNYKGNVGEALILQDGESIGDWDCLFEPFDGSPLSRLPMLADPNERVIEWNRLQSLIPLILPTITIEAHPVEKVWNGERLETHEIVGNGYDPKGVPQKNAGMLLNSAE